MGSTLDPVIKNGCPICASFSVARIGDQEPSANEEQSSGPTAGEASGLLSLPAHPHRTTDQSSPALRLKLACHRNRGGRRGRRSRFYLRCPRSGCCNTSPFREPDTCRRHSRISSSSPSSLLVGSPRQRAPGKRSSNTNPDAQHRSLNSSARANKIGGKFSKPNQTGNGRPLPRRQVDRPGEWPGALLTYPKIRALQAGDFRLGKTATANRPSPDPGQPRFSDRAFAVQKIVSLFLQTGKANGSGKEARRTESASASRQQATIASNWRRSRPSLQPIPEERWSTPGRPSLFRDRLFCAGNHHGTRRKHHGSILYRQVSP